MSHHPEHHHPSDSDLVVNPGIGQTTGLISPDDEFADEEGENTVEGDVMNDTRRDGSLDPGQRGRTNK